MGCPGKDLARRCLVSKDLPEMQESVVQRRRSGGNQEEAVQGAEVKGCLACWRNE